MGGCVRPVRWKYVSKISDQMKESVCRKKEGGREGGREGGKAGRTLLLDVVALGEEELGVPGGGGLGPGGGEGGVE